MKSSDQETEINMSEIKVDIEDIMAQVRGKIQQNRKLAFEQGLKSRSFTFDDYPKEPISGEYNIDLYDHLRQVNQPHKILGVQRVLRSSPLDNLPIVGPLWRKVQYEGHNLAIYYVNALGHEIVTFQKHVAGVFNQMVRWSQTKDDEIRLLQEEIRTLKERIESLETNQ